MEVMSQVTDIASEFIELDDSLLVPCEHCHRTFREEVVEKHARVCETVWTRRPAEKKPDRVQLPVSENELRAKRNNWRIRHRHLQAAIQSAKVYVKYEDKVEKPVATKPPIGGEIVNLVTCPTCDRRYNDTTAQRHFDYCAKRKERLALLRSSLRPKSAKEKKEERSTPQPDKDIASALKEPAKAESDREVQRQKMPEESAPSPTPASLSTNGSSVTQDSLMMLMNQMSQMMSQMSQPPMSPVPSPPLSASLTQSPIESPPQSPVSYFQKPRSPVSPTRRNFPKPLAHVRAEHPLVHPCSPLPSHLPQNQQSPEHQQNQSMHQSLQMQQSMYPFYNPMQLPLLHNPAAGSQQPFPSWNPYPSLQLQNEIQPIADNHHAVAKFCCGCGSAFTCEEDKFCAKCGAKRSLM